MSDDDSSGCGALIALVGAFIDLMVVVVVLTMVCCGMTIGGRHYKFSCVSCEDGVILEADDNVEADAGPRERSVADAQVETDVDDAEPADAGRPFRGLRARREP